ncbi:MAG: 30S ribosome-binding factor RbfA [Flaviflexus sp.]|nr:30S ribosome-binding factor RbfA [Flaviflexus sp.]
MADNPRARRVAERIHEIVATLIDRRLKDPRLGMVTVTDVRVTGDLQHATVFFTVYGSETELRSTEAALASAKGFIRSEVGAQLGLRLTPTIEFVPDALPAAARSIEDKLVEAKHRDSDVARIRQSATPAGDPDPYRVPKDGGGAADETDEDAAGETESAEPTTPTEPADHDR